MDTTYADLRDGERHDIDVEFVSRRILDCDRDLVRRLRVADKTGTTFPVLIAPGAGSFMDLQTGETYRIRGLASVEQASRESVSEDCPACGQPLRRGQPIDAVDETLARCSQRLDVEGPFGVIDQRTVVTAATEGSDHIDDWRPFEADDSDSVPEFVCDACNQTYDARQLAEPEAVHEEMANTAEVQRSVAASPAAPADETVGLAAGGAKDIDNFRENVASGYTPQPDAISDEGLFYDYYFETGDGSDSDTDALFAPRYAAATTEHPLTGETEQYLSVGLDSTLSVADFDRPRLNLVAVLDVSGSMDSPFDEYYYDEHGRRREAEAGNQTKLEAATESLCALTEQLQDDDRLGVVLFNHRAHVAKPLRDVDRTDMDAIRRHIRRIAAGGSTNLEDGFEAARDLLADGSTTTDVERRVVFMTDMMPNTGRTGDNELTRLFEDAADAGVHTTFLGMGLDANAELADTLSGIRGANHYFIHSASEFEQRLGDEFDYMVTPLVYDLGLELDAEGYEIAAVHGSPSADAATEELMHVTTLFPSAKQDGEARGGVILVRLEQGADEPELELVASWAERDGSEHTERVSVTVPDDPDSYAHSGVRKAVALTRYARELRRWASEVHDRANGGPGIDDWLLPDQRGEHERESVPLAVPDEYASRFQRLREYLEQEQQALGDDRLAQELDLLETLCDHAETTATEVPE